MPQIRNLNIESITHLETPKQFLERLPLTPRMEETVANSRQEILDVISGKDDRFLLIVGPCSIHDTKAGLEYAQRLKKLADDVKDSVLIVLRVYFEKPRTTVGWKGLINDPHLDGTFDVATGLTMAREFLLDVLALGLPTATEWLDPITPQYLADAVCWGAIGARTVESQTHRQLASGMSMPIGYKNGTGGSIQIAVDAMVAAQEPHVFLSVEEDGKVSIVKTRGNPGGHVVLRGGTSGPNYDPSAIARATGILKAAGFEPHIVVDCSHANSGKDHRRQPVVFRDVLQQRTSGNRGIVGMMLESHLKAGSQKANGDASKLEYGVSITDACVDWETTERLVREARSELKAPAGVLA
ncbi:MAG: 3-deoxy-7-phosphoheptulonate synthase [Chloroflexi bacterium]|nr:3-deoxy-7-phosphoheptulonate synthase [Chloroflexota bacterium]